MKAIVRLVKWAAVGFSALFVLILIGLLLSPWLLNTDLVKQNLINRINKETGGRLTYQKVDILFFPRPYLFLQQAQITIPDSVEGSLSWLKVYPQVLPLLQGEIRFTRVDIQKPQLTFNIPTRAPDTTAGSVKSTEIDIKEVILAALSQPLFHEPGLNVRLIDGQLNVLSHNRTAFSFKELTARIDRSPETIIFKVRCTSNISERISLTGHINHRNLNGSLQANIHRFKPHLLTKYFLSKSPLRLVNSNIDLDVDLETSDSNLFRVEVRGRHPVFVFRRGKRTMTVRGKKLNAAVRSDNHSLLVSLGTIELNDPPLKASGHLFHDSQRPEVRLDISGIGVSVEPLREKFLAIAGDVLLIETIFEIINGGHVPAVSVTAKAQSFEALADVEKFIVKGSMSEGKLYIPEAELNLEHCKGNVIISEGVLKGTDVKGQLGNSSGKNGELTLDLNSRSGPFRLEVDVLADVTQIPPILARLIPNEPFRNELDGISRLDGEAFGRLIIGNRLDDLHVTAIVTDASLSADYARIPYPIKISGGSYYFDDMHCIADNIHADIGQSNFPNLSFKVNWGGDSWLNIDADRSTIALPQLVDWVSSFASLQPHLKYIDVIDGSAVLPKLHLHGPLKDTGQWRYSTSGHIENLTFQVSHFPGKFSAGMGEIGVESDGHAKALVTVSAFESKWQDSQLVLSALADVSGNGIDFNANLTLDTLNWDQLSKITEVGTTKPHTDIADSSWDSPISGVLKVQAATLNIGDITARPATADFMFQPEAIDITINRVNICGISVPGKARITPRSMTLDLQPSAKNENLGSTVACLWKQEGVVDGNYQLSGILTATQNKNSFVEALNGDLSMEAGSGRIYQLNLLAKILALINVTEIIKGRIPDVFKEGFAYRAIRADGYFENGNLVLKDGIIEGVSMTIFAEGTFNFVEQDMDLIILVSPFKTIDSILKKLPLIKELMGKGLIAFWYRVKGKWDDYEITAITAEEEPHDIMR
jgi:hypothetical protein